MSALATNARYLLDHCPHTIRMREGGGPEDLAGSLALTFAKMQSEIARLTAGRGVGVDQAGAAGPALTLETMAEIVHLARWRDEDAHRRTPFAQEDRSGREYCLSIAASVLARLADRPAAEPAGLVDAVRAYLASEDAYAAAMSAWRDRTEPSLEVRKAWQAKFAARSVIDAALSRLAPASGADAPVEPRPATDRALREAVETLTTDEGDTVTFCADNFDFNGLPNCLVVVCAGWTGWRDREFRADTREACLDMALAARLAATGKGEA